MSGVGERFRQAGYRVPKPLIEIDGKPIVQYVAEMFPGETDFIFVCNREHLADPNLSMRQTLDRICPRAKVVAIAPHKLGPVHTVLQAIDAVDPLQPTIVNYCDFTCDWDYGDFRKQVNASGCDGAIPCYRGFHPHTVWSSYYAYVRESGLRALDVQEKQPFTPNPREEFASSGTYYFRTGALMRQYFEQCVAEKLMVGNEYYVSMTYQPMIADGRSVLVYELRHFMQWGTPADLEEYQSWSAAFRALTCKRAPARHSGALLVPMAGLGERFARAGYTTSKPLIEVDGQAMAARAVADLPVADRQRFVLRSDMPGRNELVSRLQRVASHPDVLILAGPTDGQATTCVEGAAGLDPAAPVTIGACDNGMIYDARAFEALLANSRVDVIVWGARGYPGARHNPKMYGWIDADSSNDRIRSVSVKEPLGDPANDPIVVGTFTFRRLSDLLACIDRMKNRQARVNEEYYVDTAINDAVALGLDCRLFEINHYICWGTPDDLRTYQYWQQCFHHWPSHPYRLQDDPHVPASKVAELAAPSSVCPVVAPPWASP